MVTTKSYTQYTSYEYGSTQRTQYIITVHTVSIHHAVAAIITPALRPPTTWVNTSQHLTELADWLTDWRGPTRRDRLSRRGGQSPIVARSVAELCVWQQLPCKSRTVFDHSISSFWCVSIFHISHQGLWWVRFAFLGTALHRPPVIPWRLWWRFHSRFKPLATKRLSPFDDLKWRPDYQKLRSP